MKGSLRAKRMNERRIRSDVQTKDVLIQERENFSVRIPQGWSADRFERLGVKFKL